MDSCTYEAGAKKKGLGFLLSLGVCLEYVGGSESNGGGG